MLIIFRFTSNQQGIKKAKATVSAYVLEMRLYSHNLAKMLAALGKTFLSNFIYLRHMLFPIIFIIVPVMIVLIQTSFRYEYRSLQPGEGVIVKAVLKKDFPVIDTTVILRAPKGIVIETNALRIASLNEIAWRISAQEKGNYELIFYVNGKEYGKSLHAGEGLSVLSAARVGSTFSSYLFNHAEPELPGDSIFTSLQIIYPQRILKIIGIELHWLVWFFLLSLVFSFAFKNVFKVEL